MKTLRLIGAALAAGAAATAVPVTLTVYVIATDTGLDNLGQPDDAPKRAAGLLLSLSPIFMVLIGGLMFVGAAVLHGARRHALKTLLSLALLLGAGLGALFSVQGYGVGGVKDAAISFAMFGVGGFATFALGAIAWWYCSPWKAA